ncbi:hypothetical protein [Pseudonocardia humida]|uniref:F0F1-type ATP synthase membrane subunit b/b n=1 Tax=Pseudonocardia humida TaxID=2800819 RepID=A0ABT1A9C9_9PSEU|nr:hypothetical protein [Pseudonocardia humida]MCO1659608.1 hypothetical protein [Pseudonocardia humida]
MTQHTSGPAPAAPPAGTTHASPGGGAPATEVARDQAGQVGGAAADAGRQVAGTAKEQAGQVAEQARREAKDLYHQARGQVTEQAKGGQQKATEALRSLAAELKEMAGGEHHGPASDLAAQAAGRVDDLAGWLDGREPGDLVQEVRSFARRRPGLFLAGAALAGVLAGRLTRGAVDANRDTSGSSGLPQRAGGTGPVPHPTAPGPHYAPAPPGYPPGPQQAPAPGYRVPPPAPMPYDRPGGALPPEGPLDAPGGGVPPSAEPRPYTPPVAPAPAPRPGGPAHALRPEGTTVGEYVDDLERGGVPPRHESDGPR